MSDFDFSPYKVLLCDTDPDVIEIARSAYLEANIGDFVATPSAVEAINHTPVMKPDLILMALNLPKMNGIQAIQKIRSLNNGEFYKTPILMLLDKVSQNMLREACRAGIEGALRKPLGSQKILRFSRAVMQKPRRFVCIRHYFGPERRLTDVPLLPESERRQNLENSTDEFTRPLHSRPIEPRKSDNDSSPLYGSVSDSDTQKQSVSVFEFDKSESRFITSQNPISYGETVTPAASNGNYDLTDGPSSAKITASNDVDFAPPSHGSSSSSVKDIDYGSSTDRAEFDSSQLNYTSQDRSEQKNTDIRPAQDSTKTAQAKPDETAERSKKSDPDAEKVMADPTGPDSNNFEEVVDLEECLDLHKLWINSGGKSGKQAKRPHSNFDGKELADVDFTKAILPQSNFENVNCVNAVFRKADLSGSTFKGALLNNADLRVSLLRKADLRNARMDKANLLGADLAGANLEGATLRGVNMSGANLTRTNLCGVNLSAVQGLIPEQLSRAITDSGTRIPMNSRTA
jgi:uncharacterized protein YjbI with pentapeptide repeats/CheY-like chemotaxis protein